MNTKYEINYYCAIKDFNTLINKFGDDNKHMIYTRILLYIDDINQALTYYKKLGLESYIIKLVTLKKILFDKNKLKFVIDNNYIDTDCLLYIIAYNYKNISLLKNYNINVPMLIFSIDIHFKYIIEECLKIGITYDMMSKQTYEDFGILYYILNSHINYEWEDICLLFNNIVSVKKELLIKFVTNVYHDMSIISYGVMYGLLSNTNFIIIEKIIRYLRGIKIYQDVYNHDKDNIDKILKITTP